MLLINKKEKIEKEKQEQIDELNKKVEELNTKNGELNSKNEELGKNVEVLASVQVTLKESEENNGKLKEELENEKKEKSEEKEKKEQLEKENEELKAKITAVEASAASGNEELLNQKNAEIESIKQEKVCLFDITLRMSLFEFVLSENE